MKSKEKKVKTQKAWKKRKPEQMIVWALAAYELNRDGSLTWKVCTRKNGEIIAYKKRGKLLTKVLITPLKPRTTPKKKHA